MSSRALQCSLATVNLATHLGRMKPEALPNQVKLRELVVVMGVLATESALSLILCLDRQTQLFMARKKALRERVLKDFKPPSTSIALWNIPLLSGGSLPRERVQGVERLRLGKPTPITISCS